MRKGGPLQGRGTGTRRPGGELRPEELRTAEKGVDATRKLEQGTEHAPGTGICWYPGGTNSSVGGFSSCTSGIKRKYPPY